MSDDRHERGADEDHVGLFGSWRALYAVVIAYTLGLTALLYVLSRLLDHSG